ncbi:MAG: hypothetical protein KF753_02160 [Caldilineaceae bacterium]|nr:hypothetical protein [Caldilineaceae bacterium]
MKSLWQEWQDAASDENRWKDRQERGLLKAEHIQDFVLRLWFEEELDVSIYELDFRPLFVDENPGGIFAALRDQKRFELVSGDYTLNWLNPDTGTYDETAIDIAPECIRFFCERYGKLLKAASSTEVVPA